MNPESLEGRPRIIAVPNCTIITALMAVAPLHRAAGLRSLILSSYQSVSGAGHRGVTELAEQIEKLHGMEDDLAHPDPSALPVGEVFGKTIAYNVVAKVDAFDLETGFTFEEIKIQREARKILSMPGLEVAATAVRVPVPVGHSVSIHATFSRPIGPRRGPRAPVGGSGGGGPRRSGERRLPQPARGGGPGRGLVGRIRQSPDRPDALLLFSCGDNLRKGAALNAVQIAERLFA